jgi:hypothetical protein
MKKYIFNQLTQVSAWIGFLLVVCALVAPRGYLAILGVVLMLTHDDTLKNWVIAHAPWLQARYNDIEKAFEESDS